MDGMMRHLLRIVRRLPGSPGPLSEGRDRAQTDRTHSVRSRAAFVPRRREA